MPTFGRSPRKCRNCGKMFDQTVPRSRKYCDEDCRKQYLKTIKLANKAEIDAIPTAAQITPHVKAMRALAFENLQDEVREVLREETRKQVTEHLKDNILGATEALTALLPAVLEGLANDVEHEDWMRRSRAQALVMKYAFAHKDDPAQTEDRMNINIFHGVPIPDSPFGDRMIEHQVDRQEAQQLQIPAHILDPKADPNEVIELPEEAFELAWPVCGTCGERKHPETFATLDDDRDRKVGRCRTCEYAIGVRAAFRKREKPGPQARNDETADWDKPEYGPEV